MSEMMRKKFIQFERKILQLENTLADAQAKVNELTSSLNSYKDKLRESEVIREEFQYACNDAYHILYASYGGDSPVLKAPSPTQKASDILDKVLNYKYSLRSANEQLQPKH
jgi:hypothetical protein